MNATNLQVHLEAQEINAELEGMKAENERRCIQGEVPAYGENDFYGISLRLSDLARNISHD